MALRFRLPQLRPTRQLLQRAEQAFAAGDAVAAVKLLARAAERDDPEACQLLARAYLDGRGVPRSGTEGMRWLERAAQRDHVPAQALLAALLLRGLGTAADAPSAITLFQDPVPLAGTGTPAFTPALQWARRAAAAGSADGRAVLAYILTSGPEAERDPAQAIELYRLAAEAGSPQGALGYAMALAAQSRAASGTADASAQPEIIRWLGAAAQAGLPSAQYMLGEVQERGMGGVPVDLTAALALYKAAAAQGHRNAQARYGVALMHGRGVAQDALAGESWLRRAALAGDPEAAALVGDLYARGGQVQGGTLPPNFLEAALWYRRAAETGHGAAARALGMLYLTGAGVGRDAEEAAIWFRLAADRGDVAAQADLGNLALRGGGTPADLARSREWFETAAERGDPTAAFNLGVCLLEGVGVVRDAVRAAHWLHRAAAHTSAPVANAQFWYGRMLTQGNGVPAEPASGREWIAKAAAAGLAEAQVLLGSMLVNGEGGAQDHAGAQVWFAHAAARGHAGAMFALGALAGGGHDVPVDRELAQNWFRAAAEKGHAHAKLMLGRYLARGLADQTDLVQARHWLEQALAQGVTEAEADLLSLPPPAALGATG